MHTVCPHCEAAHVLPERLLGPGGARVRCPRCGGAFLVPPAPAPAALAEAAPLDPAGLEPLETVAPDPRSDPADERELAALRARFERTAEGAPVAPGTPAGAPADAAEAVLDALERDGGEALARARAEGRLFAAFGPALAAAFDEYRRRAGGGADAAAFRRALRRRFGVDLDPPA